MKKLILSLLLLPALCAQAWTYDFPTLEDATAYVEKYAPVVAPSAVSPDGIIYQAGLYDQMTMIGEDILENIATSAFISAMDTLTQAPKWSVGIQGASRITQIITDATGENIYVAGTFADDIIIGSTDLNTQSLTGTAESHNRVNAFVAKYSKAGILQSVLPIIPQKNARYGNYESDLIINPTSLALFGGKLYIGLTYMGGFTAGSVTQYGTVKSSFGYWDSLCGAILTWDGASEVKQVLDVRSSDAVSTTGLCPQSLCLTASGQAVYVGIFTSGTNTLTVNGQSSEYSFAYEDDGDVEYGALMVKMDASGYTVKQFNAGMTDRYYKNNIIKSMQLRGNSLYLSGCISTPLPFKDSLVPDLWSDQFAVCLDATTYATKWAYITGALRDDMPNMNAKYRQSIAATLAGNDYIVIGSVNFVADKKGQVADYSTDYCLGVSAGTSTLALTTKTDQGSRLTVSRFTPVPDDDVQPTNPYDIDGDGIVTVSDITTLINLYLGGE